MDNPAEILKLEYPLDIKGQEPIFELEFRRLKGRDLKDLPNDPAKSTFSLISRLTGLPPSTIEELDGKDLGKAQEIVESFLPKSRKTGDSSTDY